jgi:hypothetical protein
MKQTTKSQTTTQESLSRSDPAIAKLAKVAFANVADFARFNPDGSVEIFDWEKAKEIGAKVSVVTRKEGTRQECARAAHHRNQNAKQVSSADEVAEVLNSTCAETPLSLAEQFEEAASNPP